MSIIPGQNSLLLVLPVPHYEAGGKIYFEAQASHGAEMWAGHFDSVIIASPRLSKEQAESNLSMIWMPTESIPSIHRISFIPLPQTHTPKTFMKALGDTRKKLRNLITSCKYLQFAVGGLLGDWASIAAYEARAMGRPYTVHMDWIAHNVIKQTLDPSASWLEKTKRSIICELTKWWNNRAIADASAALCNGETCYDYYKTINPRSHLVYDIHVGSESLASPQLILEKKKRVKNKDKLSLCYAGRLDPMKAPVDWLRALAHARDLGAEIRAAWYGVGPLKETFELEIDRLHLREIVSAPGYISDRKVMLNIIGQSDLFLITHITDESPRCVIESLMRATPVIGYSSPYASEILGNNQAGILCAKGDWQSLGKLIARIHNEKECLSDLIDSAADRGRNFTDEKVFEERAKIIKGS